MRLIIIRNELKRIVSTSGGLERLQMVSNPDTRQWASEDTSPQVGGLCDLTLVREMKEIFLTGCQTSP